MNLFNWVSFDSFILPGNQSQLTQHSSTMLLSPPPPHVEAILTEEEMYLGTSVMILYMVGLWKDVYSMTWQHIQHGYPERQDNLKQSGRATVRRHTAQNIVHAKHKRAFNSIVIFIHSPDVCICVSEWEYMHMVHIHACRDETGVVARPLHPVSLRCWTQCLTPWQVPYPLNHFTALFISGLLMWCLQVLVDSGGRKQRWGKSRMREGKSVSAALPEIRSFFPPRPSLSSNSYSTVRRLKVYHSDITVAPTSNLSCLACGPQSRVYRWVLFLLLNVAPFWIHTAFYRFPTSSFL